MRWPPYRHVFFDCDSTLTSVEGIDILAESAGKGWRISVLTEAAMNGDLEMEEIYAKRLRALRPTRREIRAIRQVYKQHMVPDAGGVIAALQSLGHQVYIISGGLAEPVIDFGLFLGVPRENIKAVPIEYDRLSGTWWQAPHEWAGGDERYMDYAEDKLTVSDGKAQIVRQLLAEQDGRSLLVGDGVSDLLAGRAVDLFVGYGGVTHRPRVSQEAPAYISSPSLAPLLALAAGPAGLRRLAGTAHQPIVQTIETLVTSGAITFKDDRLKAKFNSAWHGTQPASRSTVYPRSD
jgi:phosphoserine phosphatase